MTATATEKGQELSKNELKFLYEMDGGIEGFGNQKDPRIEEIKEKRNIQEDLSVIFECQPNQIAFSKEQIAKDTVAYIGEWTPEVLNLMPESVKYICEKSPDQKVFWKNIETNPDIKNSTNAINALEQNGFKTDIFEMNAIKKMLDKIMFSGEKQKYEVVSFSVGSLGFTNGAEYKDIIAKAKEFGLEFCPAELGPQLRLQYKDQPDSENLKIGMKPIIDEDSSIPSVFTLNCTGAELWLGCDERGFGFPDDCWQADDRFVFVRPRKK